MERYEAKDRSLSSAVDFLIPNDIYKCLLVKTGENIFKNNQ
jgi:hypothetical protein